MSDTVQYPIPHMIEEAQRMQNETSQLANETSSHIQSMYQHASNLPASMQGPFGNFLDGIGPRMSKGITVRAQMSKLLGDAATTAASTDADVANGFKGFTDEPHQ